MLISLDKMESEIDRLYVHLHKSRYDTFKRSQFSTEIDITGKITGISVSLCKVEDCTY